MIYQDQIYQGVLGASAPLLKGALLKNKILEKLRKNWQIEQQRKIG